MKQLVIAGILLGLSGTVMANEANDLFKKLPNFKQRSLLAQVIRSSGEHCSTVNTFKYYGSRDGTAMWVAQCSNYVGYMVGFQDDAAGSTLVMSCADLASLGADCNL